MLIPQEFHKNNSDNSARWEQELSLNLMSKLHEALTAFRSHPEQCEGITNLRIRLKTNKQKNLKSRWQPVKKQSFQWFIVPFLPLFVFSCVCPRKGSCARAHLSHQSFVSNPGLAWVPPAQGNRETQRGGDGVSGHGKWGCAQRTQNATLSLFFRLW